MVVNGSGTASEPIVFTSYGSGDKPIISGKVGSSGGGDYQQAIYVLNNDNMVFENLEVQNNRQAPRTNVDNSDSFGIHIHNTSEETLNNFVFKNMTFKNVYAIAQVDPSTSRHSISLKLLELGFLQIGIKHLLTMFWLKTVISQICKDLEFMPSTP